MNGVCHKIAGISTGVVLTHFLYEDVSVLPLALITFSSMLGSLVPDIDEPNSIVGRKVKHLSGTLKKVFGHRGIIHTPFFLLIIFFLLFQIKNSIPIGNLLLIGFVSGYISHLILDMLTPAGLMIFYPFSKKKYRLLSLKGEHRDLLVSLIIVFSIVMFLLFRYDIISINNDKLNMLANFNF